MAIIDGQSLSEQSNALAIPLFGKLLGLRPKGLKPLLLCDAQLRVFEFEGGAVLQVTDRVTRYHDPGTSASFARRTMRSRLY